MATTIHFVVALDGLRDLMFALETLKLDEPYQPGCVIEIWSENMPITFQQDTVYIFCGNLVRAQLPPATNG